MKHGRFALALVVMAFLIFAAPSYAGNSTHQTVSADGSGNLTWTGGDVNTPNANDDGVTFSDDGNGAVTVTATTDSQLHITVGGNPGTVCTGGVDDNVTLTSVVADGSSANV